MYPKISQRTPGSCRAVAVRDANARANREAYRKYPDTKEITMPENQKPRQITQKKKGGNPMPQYATLRFKKMKGGSGAGFRIGFNGGVLGSHLS